MAYGSIWHSIGYWIGRKSGPNDFMLVCPDRAVQVDMKNYQTARDCVTQNADAFAVVTLPPAYVKEQKFSITVCFDGKQYYAGAIIGREAAIEEARRMYAELRTEKVRYDSDPEYALAKEISQYDRYAAYSDDIAVGNAGDQHLAKIRELEKKVGNPEKVKALWEKHQR